MALSPGTRLGPYEVLAPLGAGGMGEVYRARDTRLGREVAVKVLAGDLADDPKALARFQAETRAVAALSHTNILALHDVGDEGGIRYAVTELLEGETLRALLRRGAIPVRRALEIAGQVADGLASAHEAGIVHRDVKPENVFLTKDGRAKILDFGLARHRPLASSPGEEDIPTASVLTDPGTVLGTVAYMSPEQASGKPVDHRSDQFSLGVVLYEMLTEKRPFGGATAAETLAAIIREEPEPLETRAPKTPAPVRWLVDRCLSKDPHGRYDTTRDLARELKTLGLHASLKVLEKDRDLRWQSAKEVRTDLRRRLRDTTSGKASVRSSGHVARPPSRRALVIGAGAIVLLLVLGGAWLTRRWAGGRAPKPIESGPSSARLIAVLPFENLGAAEDAYFADAMTDEVRSRLAGLSGVSVIASTSTREYRATTKPAAQIAKELGVGYLLIAKVRWQKAGQTSRVRVTPELVEVGDGPAPTTRWQEGFEADLSDVFRVQGEIAAKVAESMKVVLSGKDRGLLAARPTSNLEAYDAFLKGKRIWSGGDLRAAVPLFEKAVALDPGFALAWTSKSQVHTWLFLNHEPSRQQAEAARKAAERAMELAPDLPQSIVALGLYHSWVRRDFKQALEVFSRGLKVAPHDAVIILRASECETALGRWEEVIAHLHRARRLDPRNPYAELYLGNTLLYQHRVGEARQAYDRALNLAPDDVFCLAAKATTYLLEGDLAGAQAAIAAAPKEVEPTRLVARLCAVNSLRLDLEWILDDAHRELLLHTTPSSFQDDRGTWGLVLARASARRGDVAKVREYAEEARKALAVQVAEAPARADRRLMLGLSFAYLGRKEEAVSEGARGVALLPISQDATDGPRLQHQLVLIHILCGNHEKALDLLEPLLKVPYILTPGWLRIDPNFDPLRGNPRFEKLAQNPGVGNPGVTS